MNRVILQTINELKELDKDQIIRPNLGDASFKDFQPVLNEIFDKVNFIEKYYEKVPENINSQTNNHLVQIKNQLSNLVNFDKSQFVSSQENIKNHILGQLNSIRINWPHYAITALDESGLLNSINLSEKFKNITKQLKDSTDEALTKIENESNSIVNQAKKKADEIESSIRKTAAKISVKEAQDQFEEASLHNLKHIKIWAIISSLLIIVFVVFINNILNEVQLEDNWNWKILYHSIIRLGVLGLIGTILRLSINMLKANLHMYAHNLHRKRISNSMASFAESAMNKEQRDLILSQLVESVSSFGNSGIISKGDDSSKISIDSISKTVSTLNEK